MQLQKIELPKEYEAERTELYFHANPDTYRINKGSLVIFKGQSVSFDTYFNAFSAVKWAEYTVLNDITFKFRASGKGVLSVYSRASECKKITECPIDSDTQADYSLRLCLGDYRDGIIFVKIDSDEEIEFAEAGFTTEMMPVRNIFISLVICTYRREEYVKKNLRVIEECINSGACVLKGHLNVKVIDNGNTLKDDVGTNELISLYPNKNAGGVGGFTKGMLISRDEGIATHVLLMDDDVEIKISALEKTYILLSYAKEKYNDIIVGGAMLRNDCQYIQHEAGAWYEGGRYIKSRNRGLDLRDFDNVCRNEKEEAVDYNAWWYCCMPIEILSEIGLPLPLFIHFDDLEYGIRSGKRVVLINGICVWHNTFEHKRSSVNEYYDVRNNLIVNTIHAGNAGRKTAVRIVTRRLLTNLFRYRYKDMLLVNRAVNDFFKGPDFLKNAEPQEIHKELAGAGYRYDEEYSGKLTYKDSISCSNEKIDKKKLLSLNGWLLPARVSDDIVPIAAGETPHRYYRVKNVWIYDPDTEKGFYSKKKPGQLFVCLGMIIRQTFRLTFFYGAVKRKYSQMFGDITAETFWKKYLDI